MVRQAFRAQRASYTIEPLQPLAYPPSSPHPLLDFRCSSASSLYLPDDEIDDPPAMIFDANITWDVGKTCERVHHWCASTDGYRLRSNRRQSFCLGFPRRRRLHQRLSGPDRIPRYRVATVNFLITDLAQASDNPLRCYTGRPDIHRHCRATLPSPESVWWIDSQARSPKRATLGPE